MWSHFVQSRLLEWIQVVVLVRLFGSYRKWLSSMLSLSVLLICSALKLIILFLNKSMTKCLCVWFKIFYLMEFVLGAFNVKEYNYMIYFFYLAFCLPFLFPIQSVMPLKLQFLWAIAILTVTFCETVGEFDWLVWSCWFSMYLCIWILDSLLSRTSVSYWTKW